MSPLGNHLPAKLMIFEEVLIAVKPQNEMERENCSFSIKTPSFVFFRPHPFYFRIDLRDF